MMAVQVLFCTAVLLLISRIYADSCVSKPCGSDYRVTSWNPVREGSDYVYYYQVQTDGCSSNVFTDVLLQTSLSCQDCANVYCYDSYWRRVRCDYPAQWVTSDSFLNSKGVSTTSGLKWTLPRSNVLRFSVNVNPATTTSAQGRIYTKGNSWSSCSVTTPVCKCTCSPCPSSCYRPSYQTYPSCTCHDCTPCQTGCYQRYACNSTSNTNCANCTQCVAGTYETVPCTTTSNRICTNCTQCVANMTYQVTPCGGTQNRQCANCTQCRNGTYETRPCNVTQNRICTNCTQCVTNMTYETVPCSGVTNRQCRNCTVCVAGKQYQTRNCNATMDRACNNCTVCIAGTQYQTRNCSATVDRSCNNCTVCIAGTQYQTRNCNATMDRSCNNCTVCVAGMQYETRPCGATVDRNCTNCTVCDNGFFETAPCNSTTDRVCQRCSNCSANEQVLFPCNATNDIVCVPCPECANCTAIPNSHLSNNGLNCSCNEGYTQVANVSGTFCVPTPCCADCQSCNFNASSICLNPNPDLCNYDCDYSDRCVLGRTPAQTGYTITYSGTTIDAACCGATGGDCTCFSYQLASSTFILNDFVLGTNCRELQQCDGLSTDPCLQTILRDGVDGQVIFGIPGSPNPFTNVTGIAVTDLNLFQDATTLTFLFQGHYNESGIPITFSAGAQPNAGSEDRTCLISSLPGPNCLSCPSP